MSNISTNTTGNTTDTTTPVIAGTLFTLGMNYVGLLTIALFATAKIVFSCNNKGCMNLPVKNRVGEFDTRFRKQVFKPFYVTMWFTLGINISLYFYIVIDLTN